MTELPDGLPDELLRHAHALEDALQHMERTAAAEQAIEAEIHALYHLGELFTLLAVRREWQRFATHAAAVRAANPQQPQHLHQLALYDGFVALRTQEYARGEAILMILLEQTSLSDALRVQVLNGLGQIHWFQAQYEQALAFYQRVLTLAQATGDLLFQGYALLNMSMIYNEIGYYDQALDYSTQSLHLFRQLGDRAHEAHALSEIGNNALQLGRWEIAQEHLQEAIMLYQVLGLTAPLANLYGQQGLLHHLLGADTASETAYRRGLSITQAADHDDPAITMDILLHLGFLYQTQARGDAAVEAYEEAMLLAERLGNQYTLALIAYRWGTVLKDQGRRSEAMELYRRAIECMEALRVATTGEEIKLGLLGTAQQMYEAMVLLCLQADQVAKAFAYVERARSRAFLDILAGKAPELYDSLDEQVVTLPELQKQLPHEGLLIEYFTIGVLPQGEALINRLPAMNTSLRTHLTLPPQVVIFAVAHDHVEVHVARLDPNTIRPSPGDTVPGRRWLRDRVLDALHERLIGPVQHLLQERTLLYLIPHGPLHYVPFLAMRSADGHYLLDTTGPMVAFAPSASVLLRSCLQRSPRSSQGLLALGYNDEGPARLEHAEAEARSIARLMHGEAWTGPEPKAMALRHAMREVRWLHFAGHAVYDPHDPLASELHLGKNDRLNARAIMADLDLHADLVTLSACMSGLSHVRSGDELLGLQRAFLYAGATTVVCTQWEASDVVTRLVMEHFYVSLQQGRPMAAALRDAQVFVREMSGAMIVAAIDHWHHEHQTDAPSVSLLRQQLIEQPMSHPFAAPVYWAPFMLIGRPG